jgi:1,4-dihydroxy-6-naphthoate synthase
VVRLLESRADEDPAQAEGAGQEVGHGAVEGPVGVGDSKKGLSMIADMGEYWENLTGLPIPLGAIVINRRVPHEVALKVNRVIRRSLEYAYQDSLASYDFVTTNAKEMDRNVMNNHIKLFVNKFTLNLGDEGKRAVKELFRIANERGVIPTLNDQIFLNPIVQKT